MVLTIKVNLAKPLPLYFSGFFLIFFKLILLKINANGKPRPAVNGERTKEIKLITLRGSWVFFLISLLRDNFSITISRLFKFCISVVPNITWAIGSYCW